LNYLKNIKLLYASTFFHNLIFAYVIERLFWQQRGMTIQMVVYAEIIYAVTIIILEIPTGILADKWSRKNLLVIGALLACIELILIIFAHTFWQFGIAIFIAGISKSLVSGSENALLYDSLKHHSKEHEYEKVLGRLKVFDYTSSIIAGLCGGFLSIKFSFEFHYWISLVSMSIALLLTLFIKETALHTQNENKTRILDYIKTSFNFFKSNSNIVLIIASGFVLGACMNYVDEFWQIYLNELSFPVTYFGIFSAFTSLAIIPGSLLSYKLKAVFSYKKMLLVLIISFTTLLFIAALCKGIVGMVAIIIVGFIIGIIDPLVSGYLHHRIPSDIRATMDSVQSLGNRVIIIIVGLSFGYFATNNSIFVGFGSLAVVCCVYMLVFVLASKKIEL